MLQAIIRAQVQPVVTAKVTARVQQIITAKITAQLGGSIGGGGHYELYEGPYTAEPDFAGQTLETKGKVMQDDVTVQPIAVASVSNNAGGRTIYIGGILNA